MDSIQGKRILIIDDEPEICELVELTLAKTGAETYCATDGLEGLRCFRIDHPHLVILDIMMPTPDGLELCSQFLSEADVPIIFLTALGTDNDVIEGLERGAVDYVTKPFSPKVLLARVQAALRQAAAISRRGAAYSDGHLTINVAERNLLVRGESVKLTPTEWRLLGYLVTHADRPVTFQDLLLHIWGPEYHDSINYVHVHVSRLRRKLEPNPRQPTYVHSVRGLGYRFVTSKPR